MAVPGDNPKTFKDYVSDYTQAFKASACDSWKSWKACVKESAKATAKSYRLSLQQNVGALRGAAAPYTSQPKIAWDYLVGIRNEYLFRWSLPARTNFLALVSLGVLLVASKGRFRRTAQVGLVGAFVLTPELLNPFNKSN